MPQGWVLLNSHQMSKLNVVYPKAASTTPVMYHRPDCLGHKDSINNQQQNLDLIIPELIRALCMLIILVNNCHLI